MKEGGVDLSISSLQGVFAPKGTPPKLIYRVSAALGKVAANPQFQKKMNDLLLGVRYLDTPQFKAFFAQTDKVTLDLIQKLGLQVSESNVSK
jgi:tripartite-type tricarboxylate transporter receptor subunit TctC